jgi:hypothetical protein
MSVICTIGDLTAKEFAGALPYQYEVLHGDVWHPVVYWSLYSTTPAGLGIATVAMGGVVVDGIPLYPNTKIRTCDRAQLLGG